MLFTEQLNMCVKFDTKILFKSHICLEPIHFGIFETQYLKTTQNADSYRGTIAAR